VREFVANKVLDLDTPQFVPEEQILIGGKCLDAIGEALDEIFGISGAGLAGDNLNKTDAPVGSSYHRDCHQITSASELAWYSIVA
jgi:hypothetical protein